MYTVRILDTGNHADSVLSKVRKCLISCFKTDPGPSPASHEVLRQRLASQLSQPAVMGGTYRFVWVDEFGVRNYFIKIASYLEDSSGRCRPVLACAKRIMESLREICLRVISETMTSEEEIQALGLPHTLDTVPVGGAQEVLCVPKVISMDLHSQISCEAGVKILKMNSWENFEKT